MGRLFGLRCLLQACPFRQGSDDSGVWGECVDCGKRVGFVDRATLRAYADREWEKQRRKDMREIESLIQACIDEKADPRPTKRAPHDH